MKFKDAQKTLKMTEKELSNYELDPTRIVVDRNFGRPQKPGEDYRNAAVNELIKNELEFASDCNIVYTLAERFVTVVCPKCSETMVYEGGSGTANENSIRYQCWSCNTKCWLIFPDKGIAFQFVPKDNQKAEK